MAVGGGVREGVGVGVAVCVGDDVGVAVKVGVAVGVEVCVRVGVGVEVGVYVDVTSSTLCITVAGAASAIAFWLVLDSENPAGQYAALTSNARRGSAASLAEASHGGLFRYFKSPSQSSNRAGVQDTPTMANCQVR